MPVRPSALTASTELGVGCSSVGGARQHGVLARREYSREPSSRNRACSSSLAPAGLVLRLSLAPARAACSAETAAATAEAHRSVMSMRLMRSRARPSKAFILGRFRNVQARRSSICRTTAICGSSAPVE